MLFNILLEVEKEHQFVVQSTFKLIIKTLKNKYKSNQYTKTNGTSLNLQINQFFFQIPVHVHNDRPYLVLICHSNKTHPNHVERLLQTHPPEKQNKI